MRAILCGTSNAVLSGGYAAGLVDAGFELVNLATGASPSPQVIYQADRVAAHAGSDAVVVLDNIVNDENLLDISNRGVRRAIAAQYSLVRAMTENVVALGLCTRHHFMSGSAIARFHQDVCGALGIPFISYRDILCRGRDLRVPYEMLFQDSSHMIPELARLLGAASARQVMAPLIARRNGDGFGNPLASRQRRRMESDGIGRAVGTSLRQERVTVCSHANWAFTEPQRVFGLYIDVMQTRTCLEVIADGQHFGKGLRYWNDPKPQFMFVPFDRELDVTRSLTIRACRQIEPGIPFEPSIHEVPDDGPLSASLALIDVVSVPADYMRQADAVIARASDPARRVAPTDIMSDELRQQLADVMARLRVVST